MQRCDFWRRWATSPVIRRGLSRLDAGFQGARSPSQTSHTLSSMWLLLAAVSFTAGESVKKLIKWNYSKGTSGCVLASRLSEDPSLNVLLLEAGERSVSLKHDKHFPDNWPGIFSGKAILESVLPAGFIYLFHSKHDYDFYTVAQSRAGGKEKYWPRGMNLTLLDESLLFIECHYGSAYARRM